MRKRILATIGVALFLMLSQVSAIAGGLLFHISATRYIGQCQHNIVPQPERLFKLSKL